MLEYKPPSPTATVSELMSEATRIFRLTLAKSLPVGMFAILLAALPNMYWMTTGKPMDLLHPPADRTFWVLTAIGFAAYQLLAGILMLRQRAIVLGGGPMLQREFTAAVTRWPALVVTPALGGLAVFAGTFALVIPGIFLLVCFLLLRPVVLFEPLQPLPALLRCIRLARPIWIKVLAAGMIAALVFVVCAVAAAACLGILQSVFGLFGVQPGSIRAFAAACGLGVQAVALVYFNALWLVLYSAASSSA